MKPDVAILGRSNFSTITMRTPLEWRAVMSSDYAGRSADSFVPRYSPVWLVVFFQRIRNAFRRKLHRQATTELPRGRDGITRGGCGDRTLWQH
jgi:hypothetical protein